MLVLSTTAAVNAYNVVDEGAPSLSKAMEDEEYDGSTAKVYFMMPNGKNGPVAEDDVYIHHPEEYDPNTGEPIKDAYNELVIPKGGKTPTWCNEYNLKDGIHYPGIYWWDSTAAPAAWPGYRMEIDDADNCVFYVEVPGDGDLIMAVFNNGIDGGSDPGQPIYNMTAQSIDNNMEGAYDGDWDTLWGDTYNEWDFDGCIYVIDPNQVDINAFSGKLTCGGNWYFYYGNGCYGSYRIDVVEFTSAEDCCLNPDHFDEAGNHVGYHTDEPAVGATAEYTQVGDYTGAADVASAWAVTVTPGSDTITSLDVKVNGRASKEGAWTDIPEITGGTVVFAVAVNLAAADVESVTAVVNGSDVAATAVVE